METISETSFKVFWSLPILLQARSQWYRVLLNQKLPIAPYLHQIGKIDSSQCRLCHAADESLEHFLVTCSIKKDIWMMALNNYHYPTFTFTTGHILQALLQVHVPFPSGSNQVIPLLVLISTTQYYIWYYYWQLIIKDVPFRPDHILKTINHQVSILLTTLSNID
ncbi:hypothetical protein BD770DRAFT_242408 [Pilaira anomala]|nr:hypothetical protein BD770DRAFT_242408 [Pilaira anomala]